MFAKEFEKTAGALALAEGASNQAKSLFSNTVKPLLNKANPVKIKVPKIKTTPGGGI